ncbi:hypothetical protein [Hymenobacter volaticus]|uniref:DUF3592 domain-containing protein n=1 Tax=Hymenobacter volaticus TaxID=2932254 RepID=A0ABY4GE05_9BACT|nr:hypothetical protein [Hymenobacter volaticus]UOQ68986.1 hypothetical protein MUN86_26130 [Hymenobacter volaticus]
MQERVFNRLVLGFLTLAGWLVVGVALWSLYTSTVLEKKGITRPGTVVQIEEIESALSFRVHFTYHQQPYTVL